MKKLLMPNYPNDFGARGNAGYTSRFVNPHQSVFNSATVPDAPSATHEEVRFTVLVDDTPFEFVITRQALEDLDRSCAPRGDLLAMFRRNRERIETIALERIDAGMRWPHLVIRMQDVKQISHA